MTGPFYLHKDTLGRVGGRVCWGEDPVSEAGLAHVRGILGGRLSIPYADLTYWEGNGWGVASSWALGSEEGGLGGGVASSPCPISQVRRLGCKGGQVLTCWRPRVPRSAQGHPLWLV